MKADLNQLLLDEEYEVVPEDQLPKPMVLRNKKTNNLLFVGKRLDGTLEVLDAFVELRDLGNGECDYVKRERGMKRFFQNALEGAAGLLFLAGSPELRIILDLVGADSSKVSKLLDKAKKTIKRKDIETLVNSLGPRALQEYYRVLQEAMKDGLISQTEWKKIQRAARGAK
jgi:hypothetical protein